MDTLIALGTSAAYFYHYLPPFFPNFHIKGLMPEVYYETAAIVITLILLGRLFENRARGQTSDAIRKLIGLARDARVLRDGLRWMFPSPRSQDQRCGLVCPGEKIPVDGKVMELPRRMKRW